MKKSLLRTFATAIAFAPALAFAHPDHAHGASFMQGLMHPVAGVDHLLAMIAVGIWAAQQGGRARWIAPLSFVSMMCIGTALAAASVVLPNVETNIALSVTVLGAAIALSLRAHPTIGATIVGAFAVFHGYAHGVEAGGVSGPFVFGMLCTTAALQATGIALAIAMKQQLSNRAVRWTGASIALGGLALLVGA